VATIRCKSEISGKVWKIQVQQGAQVSKDQPMVILECMKMEIPVEAPSAGVVKQVLVSEGDAVNEGQELVVLEG
jgi:acetyl-CoA carboxylase biotin carboxyl carrier protein